MSLLKMLIFPSCMFFVRYFDDGHCLGNSGAIKKKHRFSLEKVSLIVTQGTPAMIGKKQGSGEQNKKTNAFHCLMHQCMLTAKLSGHLKEVMDKTMETNNFIGGNSSPQLCLFPKCNNKKKINDATINEKDLPFV